MKEILSSKTLKNSETETYGYGRDQKKTKKEGNRVGIWAKGAKIRPQGPEWRTGSGVPPTREPKRRQHWRTRAQETRLAAPTVVPLQ